MKHTHGYTDRFLAALRQAVAQGHRGERPSSALCPFLSALRQKTFPQKISFARLETEIACSSLHIFT
jgi:hypothetical protein